MSTDDTIDLLNDLIETCKDGEYGFSKSAEQLQEQATQTLFRNRAAECQSAAGELQEMVRKLGGTAEDSGTTLGAVHRGWVAVKGVLSRHDDLAILEETERGEDSAMAAYREALKADLSPAVRGLLARQYEGVKRNHAQVRSLRDQARVLKGS